MWSYVYDRRGDGVLTTTGAGWVERFDGGLTDYGYLKMKEKKKEKLDVWFEYKLQAVPWPLKVHPGNAFYRTKSHLFDHMWIQYRDLFINAPDSPYCSRVGALKKLQRCLIPLNP